MDGVTIPVPKNTPRRGMIVTGIAQAIEDALQSLPPETAPLRRMTFECVIEFREDRVVVVDSTFSVSKARGITIVRTDG